jgi:hypothetical protein
MILSISAHDQYRFIIVCFITPMVHLPFRMGMMRSWMLYCTDPLFPLSFWPATKKRSSQAITFLDPAPQRSLKVHYDIFRCLLLP